MRDRKTDILHKFMSETLSKEEKTEFQEYMLNDESFRRKMIKALEVDSHLDEWLKNGSDEYIRTAAVPIYKKQAFYIPALAIAAGAIISYWILKKVPKVNGKARRSLIIDFIKSSWPILLLVPAILLGLEAMIAFPLILVLLAIKERAKWPELKKALRYGLDFKILFLLYAVMLYKAVIESSAAAQAVFSDMQTIGLPIAIMLVVLPLIIGFATGISMAFAGVALPLLIPYIVSDSGINSHALLLAYTSGMMGLILSPLHLCLILSAEYFKANLARVYRYILPPFIMVEASALLIYYLAG